MVIAALRASPPEADQQFERDTLKDIAVSGVAYERPGKYVEVQIDSMTWAALQEWRKRRYDIEERK